MPIVYSAAVVLATALFMIWIGYPIIMAILARVAGTPMQAVAETDVVTSVSVIVATRDSIGPVRARVENLLETAYPAERLEILVVRDANCSEHWGASDFTNDRVRVTSGDAPGGKASALNAGVRVATGDVIVMADTAQRFDAGTIPALVAGLRDPAFGAVSGALELGDAGGLSPVHWYWRMEKWLRHNEAIFHSSIGVTGAVYAIRRSLWTPIPAGALLDDVFVPMSLVLRGHRIGFLYGARAYDTRTFSSSEESARKTRTLTGVLQLLALLPEIMSPQNPVRRQFIVHKLSRLLTPLLLILLLPLVMVAALALSRVGPASLLFVSCAVLLIIFAVSPLRRRFLAAFAWLYDMQLATVSAIINGYRGDWSVWKAPK